MRDSGVSGASLTARRRAFKRLGVAARLHEREAELDLGLRVRRRDRLGGLELDHRLLMASEPPQDAAVVEPRLL
jgi:hypothetical protein